MNIYDGPLHHVSNDLKVLQLRLRNSLRLNDKRAPIQYDIFDVTVKIKETVQEYVLYINSI